MPVSERIATRRGELTLAERKVAAVVLADPEGIAFGTVAQIAHQSGTSGPTVVRLATKLGYRGFPGLRGAVQEELAGRLRPAAQRIRQPHLGDVLSRTLRVELANITATLDNTGRAAFAEAVRLLAGAPRRGQVLILSGDASHGVAVLMATELSLLRPGVHLLSGSEVRVARTLAHADSADVLIVFDLSRYDRNVVETASRAVAGQVRLIAVTDSALSPLAGLAQVALTAADTGAGPFDSHAGMLVLINALLAGVSDRLRRSATQRLDRVEAAWTDRNALLDE